ncbi:hypothetical protein OS175_13450 [Marinicella sp. S1101]|uniref:hypothetical protein n=1 Tax=Marinicella marina TaxID=2996016 RepID=UPI002260C16C|nr:hypothetical protein [Marinicella marina]MCX7554880.1 hypothetical protein [Marinicella marina]MDJ1141538.1 hypothetical protein [Marinicella marina]
MKTPKDINGKAVSVGDKVRIVSLSGNWFDELPDDESDDVSSMIGEVFEIEEIDEYGQPWVSKSWPNMEEGKCHSHSIALESHEMEYINE